jgi:hypothetical protein
MKQEKKYITPPATRAHKKIQYRITNGKIKKPEICFRCKQKSMRLDAHHEDYNKPLNVIWLCPQCHRDIHNKKELKELPERHRILLCKHCLYEWEYNGKNPYRACCPRCLSSVLIR